MAEVIFQNGIVWVVSSFESKKDTILIPRIEEVSRLSDQITLRKNKIK